MARHALERARRYIASGAAVSEMLADQLLLPMALAGGGSFTTDTISSHLRTNAEVIARFLPVRVDIIPGDGAHTVRVLPAD